jgi:hypothetical protein
VRAARKEQANTLRLAPSTPKHKREGHANSQPARSRARAARAFARLAYRTDPAAIRDPRAVQPLPHTVSVNTSIDRDRFRPSLAVTASISDDGLVLLDMKGGLVLASNVIGARIWQLLEERRSRADIARQLAGEYAIAIDRAERDVAAFVAALMARGLVTVEAR